LNAEIALFFSQYTNNQSTALDLQSGNFSTLNVGDSEIKGLEWSLRWAASEQLMLGFSGNITDSEITKIDILPSIKNEGDPLDFVPDYSYSLNANYQFSWADTVPGFIRIDYNLQGKNGYADHISGFEEEVSYSGKLSILNLSLGAEWDSFQATLFVKNLLDEDESSVPISFGSPTQNRPRSLGVQLNYAF
jgi:outer membrane receptor for ferrienterochelin and colicin